ACDWFQMPVDRIAETEVPKREQIEASFRNTIGTLDDLAFSVGPTPAQFVNSRFRIVERRKKRGLRAEFFAIEHAQYFAVGRESRLARPDVSFGKRSKSLRATHAKLVDADTFQLLDLADHLARDHKITKNPVTAFVLFVYLRHPLRSRDRDRHSSTHLSPLPNCTSSIRVSLARRSVLSTNHHSEAQWLASRAPHSHHVAQSFPSFHP